MKIKLTNTQEYTVAELEAIIAEAKKKDNSNVLYMTEKPKFGDKIWCIDYDNNILQGTWLDEKLDYKRFNINNVFATKENAERARDIGNAYRELKAIARELNAGEVIDWSDNTQPKHFLYYNYIAKEWRTTESHRISQSCDVFCLSENFLEVAQERMGDKLDLLLELHRI